MKKLIVKIFGRVLKSIGIVLVGEEMIFWGLEHAAKLTTTLIDDKFIYLGKVAFEGDLEETEKALQEFLLSIQEQMKHKKKD